MRSGNMPLAPFWKSPRFGEDPISRFLGVIWKKKRWIPKLKFKFELKMMSDENKNKIGIEKIPNIL